MKRLVILGSFCLALLMATVNAHATNPTVDSATPAVGATNVVTSIKPQVVFNTAMKTSTLTTSSFYIRDNTYLNQVATNSPVASNSNKTFTITPSDSLGYCTSYTFFATTAVRSNDTNTPMQAQFSRTFTTATSSTVPTVTGKSPASAATNVLETAPVTVTFSRLMDPATINSTTFTLVDSSSIQVPGDISFSTTGNVTKAIFEPSINLASGATYTARVTTGVQTMCGIALGSTQTWSFTVRNIAVAPYVLSTVPSNSATNIARTSPITINFNKAMSTVTASNITVNDGVSNIAGTVTFDTASKLTATFTPSSAMQYNTIYTVTVTGAMDTSSNVMSPDPYTFSFVTTASAMDYYCQFPPFVGAQTKPNVLLIFDNSNSMDEDFMGNAAGSWNSKSKMVKGKEALISIIQQYADTMRLGLMTYKQDSASKTTLVNSAYFSSYDPKSYCPSPPLDPATGLDYCFDWCNTGNTASQAACANECKAQNSSFDETYMDGVISSRTVGDALRTKYCHLVYPKTNRIQNPTHTTSFIYFEQALPCYGCSASNKFEYAQTYTPGLEIVNTSTNTDTYDGWTTKTETNDDYANYGGTHSTSTYHLTDSDLALGYGNIGQRMFSTYTGGRAWLSNSSPGGGYLNIPIDSNDNVNTQKNKLLTAMTTYASTSDTGYMNTCTSTSDPNLCSYVVSAGLTPTPGTLRSAYNYFTGTADYKTAASYTSPIQYPCQKNFIIYVTDGAPSVYDDGTAGSATDINGDNTSPAIGTALYRIDQLRSITKTISGTNYPFDVRTYVLGVGLTDTGKAHVDKMAVHGGTTQAYFADNPTQLKSDLNEIFNDILTKVSSGTAASILSNNDNNGAMLLQAIFYPRKNFDAQAVDWTGELHSLWYYIDPWLLTNSIREDTASPNILNLTNDYVTKFKFVANQTSVDRYKDNDGNGTGTGPGDAFIDNVSPEDVHSLWKAGNTLWSRDLVTSPRTVYTTDGSSRINFSTTNDTTLRPWLNAATLGEADNIISYVKGTDVTGYRSRAATISGSLGTWRLGDIISSTPRLQSGSNLNIYQEAYPVGYSDASYGRFIDSNEYKSRGMAFAGANDGMLHAFNLGKLTKATASDGAFSVSKVTDYYTGGLGKEMWGFIPKNALPYLKYLADPNYSHLFYVDGSPSINDVAIHETSGSGCTAAAYWLCDKMTPGKCSNNLSLTCNTDADCGVGHSCVPPPTYGTCSHDSSLTCSRDADCGTGNTCAKVFDTSWRSVLIVGMGLGGATRNLGDSCASSSGSFPNCVNTPVTGLGYSSYLALDVTDPTNPHYLWEFSNPALGYATSGAALVRVGPHDPVAGNGKNGRWFAVFASGPTGPIDTINHQFLGASDQNLKIFVVDVKDGSLVRTIDTGIANAFAGSLSGGALDADRTRPLTDGFFTDDAIYLGYVQKDTSTGTWTKGGVLRILTQENVDTAETNYGRPDQWTFSKVIDGIGPVTSAIGKIQENPEKVTNGRLWLYFGTGRYFYKTGMSLDDNQTRQSLYGIIEPCYQNGDLLQTCISPATTPVLSRSDLQDQTSAITTIAKGDVPSGKKGWYIDLANYDADNGAQRVITDPVPLVNGLVLFTSFKPTADVCGFGGTTSLWAITYNGGGTAPGVVRRGKVVLQLSTGSFEEVNMETAFINSLGRESDSFEGVPPQSSPQVFSNAGMFPQKKILQIQEN
jgi:Tfp pilus tip-associated adhesin PilY1